MERVNVAQDRPSARQIIAALVKARDALPFMKEDLSVGSGSWGYKALGIKQIVAKLRPILAEHGVIYWPTEPNVIMEDFYESNKKTIRRVTVRILYTFAHSSGEAIQVVGLGEGADTGDKAIPKACTGAMKQMLRQLFQIESGENDPDVVHSDDLAKGRKTTSRRKKTAEPELDRGQMAARIRDVLASSPDEIKHEKAWDRALVQKQEYKFNDEEWLPIEAAYNERKEILASPF